MYYSFSLYSENEVHRPILDDVQFGRISEEDALWLDRPFEEDEVFGVVSGFNGDKSPAPDGFSMGFSQSCWSILKSDIMDVLHNFHEQAVFERSLSERLDTAEMIFQLHPASVSGSVHCSWDPQISFFSKTFIKNGSHSTI